MSKGQVVCIVEAMKLMNEIEADVAGEAGARSGRKRPARGIWASRCLPSGRHGKSTSQAPAIPCHMFRKILVANRGEIALRVIRAAREMGISTVAVHSTADSHALHVRFADEAIGIGPPEAAEELSECSRALVSAVEVTGADAVHPGYGFLSENAEFAEGLP